MALDILAWALAAVAGVIVLFYILVIVFAVWSVITRDK